VVQAKDDETMSRQKEFNDVDQANDLSIIVGIRRELIMLLKCILVLFFSASCDCICCSQACLNNQLCVLDMLCNKMRNSMCAWFS